MKFSSIVSPGGKTITISRVYEPGEKYNLTYYWKLPCSPTKQIAEKVFPGTLSVGCVSRRIRDAETLDWKRRKYVIMSHIYSTEAL
jgi:hypothetical protein